MRRNNTRGTRDLSWTYASWCATNRGSQSQPHLQWATSSRRSFGACPEPVTESVNNSARSNAMESDEKQRRRDRDIGEYIKEEPLTSLAIAGGVGFIFGGGANSRLGLALLSIAGRIALRGAATSFIVDLVTGNRGPQRPERSTTRDRGHRNGYHDNPRTDFSDPD